MIATYTNKLRLALAILFRAMSARRTGARSVARVNENNRDTGKFRLVANKLPQLKERPAGNLGALRPSEPLLNSLTNAAQVFKSETALSVCGRRNYFLSYRVVSLFSKALLFLADALGELTHRARTLAHLAIASSIYAARSDAKRNTFGERVQRLAR